MANRIPSSGALVPIVGPSGDIQWQSWTYGELTQHLQNDLTLDAATLDIASIAEGILPSLKVPHAQCVMAAGTYNSGVTNTVAMSNVASGGHNGVVPSGAGYAVPIAGVYHVLGFMTMPANAGSGYLQLCVLKNGSVQLVGTTTEAYVSGTFNTVWTQVDVTCVPNDVLALQLQNSTTADFVNANAGLFNFHWFSAA